jgi:hypothetical protein
MYEAVKAKPSQLDLLYTQALQHITWRDVPIARKILTLLLCNPSGCYTGEVTDYAALDDAVGLSHLKT